MQDEVAEEGYHPLDLVVEQKKRIAELEAENRRMREALKDVLPILDAVRYTVGLRGNQLTRIEKAKAALAEARAALSGEQKP